VAKAADRLS